MSQFDFNEMEQLLSEKKYIELKKAFASMNDADIAEFIEDTSPENSIVVFRMLYKDTASGVFALLDSDSQSHIINSITDYELNKVVEDLFIDDVVDMLEELPANVVKRILKNTQRDTRDLINQFLKYEKDSAGSIMTAEFIDFKKQMTVKEAFAKIRQTALDKETVYTCYVMDASRHLEGVVTVKDLFLESDDALIGDIMTEEIISVSTNEDREIVTALFTKYNFISLPVVDHENRLVGIVTVDDAVDVINEEATEDFQIMAATFPSEKPYLKTGVFELSRNRIVWLMALMISSMLTGYILQGFEEAFVLVPLLVTFIPMLTNTGGNAGSQTSTLIIRAMALSEIKTSDFFKIVWKEFRVSIVCGFILCLVNYVRLSLMYPDNKLVAATVVLSLFATVVIAKNVGAMLPIAAKKLKIDPAIMAAPLITTIVDAFSLVIYFSIAQKLLNIG